MSIVFKDAKIFFGGYEPTTQHNQISLEYEVEALDETTFGATSRSMKGGLKRARVQGGGFLKAATGNIDPIYFDSIDLADAVFMLAPEEISEGSTSTGFVYGFKADLLSFTPVTGRVGELQGFTIAAEGRGI